MIVNPKILAFQGRAEDYPHALIGSVESICDDLQRRRDRWDVSYIVVQGDAMEALAPVVAKLAGS